MGERIRKSTLGPVPGDDGNTVEPDQVDSTLVPAHATVGNASSPALGIAEPKAPRPVRRAEARAQQKREKREKSTGNSQPGKKPSTTSLWHTSQLRKGLCALEIFNQTNIEANNRAERRGLTKLLQSADKDIATRTETPALPKVQALVDSGEWILVESYRIRGAHIMVLKRSTPNAGTGCIVSRISTADKDGEVLINQKDEITRSAATAIGEIGIGWLVFAHRCSARATYTRRADFAAVTFLIRKHNVRVVFWRDSTRLARNEHAFFNFLYVLRKTKTRLFVGNLSGVIEVDKNNLDMAILNLMNSFAIMEGDKLASGGKGAKHSRNLLEGRGRRGRRDRIGLTHDEDGFVAIDPATYPICRFAALACHSYYLGEHPSQEIAALFIEELDYVCSPERIEHLMIQFGPAKSVEFISIVIAEAGVQLSEATIRRILEFEGYSTGFRFENIGGDIPLEMELIRGWDENPIPLDIFFENQMMLDANFSRLTDRLVGESAFHDRTVCGYCHGNLVPSHDPTTGTWAYRHDRVGRCWVSGLVLDGPLTENLIASLLTQLERDPVLREACFDMVREQRSDAVRIAYCQQERVRIGKELVDANQEQAAIYQLVNGERQQALLHGRQLTEDFEERRLRELGNRELVEKIAGLARELEYLDALLEHGEFVPHDRVFRFDQSISERMVDVLQRPTDQLSPGDRVLRYFVLRACVSLVVVAPTIEGSVSTTDVVVIGSRGAEDEHLADPVLPSEVAGDLFGRTIRRASLAIPSDARRIAAERFASDPVAGIEWLIDKHAAVNEVNLSGVPDWIWVGALPAGDGVRWRNQVSGWETKGDVSAERPGDNRHSNLTNESPNQRRPTYAPLGTGWYDGGHEQCKLL